MQVNRQRSGRSKPRTRVPLATSLPREMPCSPIGGTRDVILLGEVRVKDLLVVARRHLFDFAYMFDGVDILTLWQCRHSGVKFFDPMICGDDRFYETLNQADWYYLGEKTEYSLAARHLRERDHVLDVGCGSGEFAAHLPPRALFRGLERSPSGVARALAAGRDVVSEPLEEHARTHRGAYDAVTSFQVIEHVPDPMAVLRDMAACTKSGGRMIVATPNDESFVGVAINGILNMPPHHVTRWTASALQYAMERAGITDVMVEREPLAEVHEADFFAQMLVRAFLNARDGGVPLIRTDLGYRVVNKVARLAARWLMRSNVATQQLAIGHTIVAIGRKP